MSNKRHKIFVSAYACEPNLGSEIGVGWHWVVEMAKYFDLWVMTRESNRESIEEWFALHTIDHKPQFIYYDLPQKWCFWKSGMRGVRTYYMLWQHHSDNLVRQTMEQNGIKIYHLLTYGNALWPASSYGQKQLFIWGPTSAGSFLRSEFIAHYGLQNRAKEMAQRFMAKSLSYNRGFQSRCRDARLILCKTEQTYLSIEERYRHKAQLFTDVAIELKDKTQYPPRAADGTTRYLAVGRLESWRGFDLLIEAFALALRENLTLRLDILGDGSDRVRLMALVVKLGLEGSVVLRGEVTMVEYYRFMGECDVVVNPTLKEGAVTTAFDSLSFLKPLICVDTGGYTRYFNSDYAIVVQMDGRDALISQLSRAIVAMSEGERREAMVEQIKRVRESFTWARKGEQIRDLILSIVDE